MAGDLITSDQAQEIEGLIRQIGVDADSSSVTLATAKVGGTSAPWGYLLLSRSQALALILLMTRFVRQRIHVEKAERA